LAGVPVNVLGMKRPRPSNDNKRKAKPLPRFVFDIYRAAAWARWLGRVVAPTADAAIEAAAVEFKTDAWKLIAVPAYEVARLELEFALTLSRAL
jgi:hypothetical protein